MPRFTGRRRTSEATRFKRYARKESQRLEGVWEQFADSLSYTTLSNRAITAGAALHLPVAPPVKPVIIYGINIAVLLARDETSASAEQVPTPVIFAVTRLNASEVVHFGNNAPVNAIQLPWGANDAAANKRPWRAWMPIQLVGGADSPWTDLPMRLPLKGRIKLDVGQRLAIILQSPGPGVGTIIRMTAIGRYRAIHEQLA
jgi:hypothetical protein